jgi:NADPH-dependent 2,4-dienoyl-CoA reductase/sulfur reductase-like enzyme/rhodanese-related sulfurtransferase
MNAPRIVVVGGVAAGPKAAAKITRLKPDADVTIVEKGVFLSYAGCGLPYYVSGVVTDQADLMSTPAGALRDEVFFLNVKNVHVYNGTVATAIDRGRRRVTVRGLESGEERRLPYDKLILATGATPVEPPIKGRTLQNVLALHGVEDAERMRTLLAGRTALDVVIVGGGLIGVEVTESLVNVGSRVTIVEALPQILSPLDAEMATQVMTHMKSHGVKVLTGTTVTALKPAEADSSRVGSVETTAGTLPADMVVMAVGVRPNVGLAQDCGLEIGETGAIAVDDHLRTSDPDIFAIGDCAESRNLITGRPAYVPLGSTANKQGRVAAINATGGDDTFPGILGTSICRVFDFNVAATGLTEREAEKLGYDVETALSPAPDKPHFMPDAKLLMLKAVSDRATRRLLGLQATGPGDAVRAVDVAAMALHAGMTMDALSKVDLAYAPPYSPAMDNVITASDIVRNKLDGVAVGLSPAEVKRKMDAGENMLLLDVRSPAEVQQIAIPGAVNIPLGVLRQRLDELPRDREIVCFCKISLRGYEAALIANAAGYDAKFMDGGVAMWPYARSSAV